MLVRPAGECQLPQVASEAAHTFQASLEQPPQHGHGRVAPVPPQFKKSTGGELHGADRRVPPFGDEPREGSGRPRGFSSKWGDLSRFAPSDPMKGEECDLDFRWQLLPGSSPSFSRLVRWATFVSRISRMSGMTAGAT